MQIDGSLYASVNTNVLGVRAELQNQPQPVDYANETVEQRRTRRKKHWTPAILTGKLA